MDSYCEVKALPNPEIIQSAVMAELMQTVHALLPAFEGRIGVDFPAYGQQRTLGGIVRLMGTKADIHQLYAQLMNSRTVQDYALLTEPSDIPKQVSHYVCCQRRHTRGNSHFQRLKRRHQGRGTWSDKLEQAMLEKPTLSLSLPYVALKSGSTQQTFLLFIERKPTKHRKIERFNGYGLGLEGSAVPLF
ncbi:CRISPR-associated endonuclease Cas6f/Csy4 [invertebrate metagenome]|uniref:CRISPR-associated endonuclease Cas6f/Csy4 n=1 Tax=invertebrate metagenome TaxID=1711999 RepID=A0A2H9T5Y9_9ZZZZ